MLDNIILYKSVHPNKSKNHPVVALVTELVPDFEGFCYTRLQGWSKGNTGRNRGIVGQLAYSQLMWWSDEE